MSDTRVVLFTHSLIVLKGYVIMLKSFGLYIILLCQILCFFVQTVYFYVTRLCYCAKKSGYLVYEACKLVCKCVILLNAWFVMSTHCLILVKG